MFYSIKSRPAERFGKMANSQFYLVLFLTLFWLPVTYTDGVAYVKFHHSHISQCALRTALTATVKTGKYTVTLHLKKNLDADENAPAYVRRRGENGVFKIVRDPLLDIQGSAEYLDRINLASVKILCPLTTGKTPHYQLDGTLVLPDRKVYTVKYITRPKLSVLSSILGDLYTVKPLHLHLSGDTAAMARYYNNEAARIRRDIIPPPKQPVYIDVICFIDYSVYQRWFNRSKMNDATLKRTETKQNIRRHFAHIVNSMNLRYKAVSELYNIRLVGYFIEDEEHGEWFTRVLSLEESSNGTSVNGKTLMDSAKNWTNSVEGFPENDHIITWTAYDLYWIQNEKGEDLYGIAYIGEICKNPNRSISVVEYRDRITGDMLVATHEVAHGLGAEHDGHLNPCSGNASYIMKTQTEIIYSLEHNNNFMFSPCSIAYMNRYVNGLLDQGSEYSKSCLRNAMRVVSVTNISGEMPGQLYDPDTQCRLVFGEGSYFCRSLINSTSLPNICKRLYCQNTKDNLCYSVNAAEGTSCGNKKWCIAGECVQSDRAPQKDERCIAGDVPVSIYKGRTCSQLIPPGFQYFCYSQQLHPWCCELCQKFSSNDPDCEYGDNFLHNITCSPDQCVAKNGTDYVYKCCDTCREFRTTTVPTTSATSTMATTLAVNCSVENRITMSVMFALASSVHLFISMFNL